MGVTDIPRRGGVASHNPRMELFTAVDQPDVPPRAAATVMVLRASPNGPEVLMLKRHSQSGVLGGAYVFPGGKVDVDDALADAQLLGISAESMAAALNEGADAEDSPASLFCAALRETYEECGLLFAREAGADKVAGLSDALGQGQSWTQALRALGIELDAHAVVPWSRWITPKASLMMNKRFDTRFFVAVVPDGQVALHDGHEATDSVWVTPEEGLRRYEAGDIDLAPPQIMSLVQLGMFTSLDALLAFARSRPVGVIMPHHFKEDDVRVLCYPGDPAHPESVQLWPGATRIYHRNARFEAQGGGVMSLLASARAAAPQ
ncbi:MAG: hypothetical protein RL357_1226 [Pseudomonadota bacterium]